jgi:hypothetical protein
MIDSIVQILASTWFQSACFGERAAAIERLWGDGVCPQWEGDVSGGVGRIEERGRRELGQEEGE